MIKDTLRAVLRTLEYLRLSPLLRQNEGLRNRHAGQRAYLFATGASLAGMDLSEFNGKLTIGCNNIFRHPSFPSFQLKYFVAGVPFRRWRQLSPRFTHEDHEHFFSAVDDAFRNRDTVHLYHATLHQYLQSRALLSNASRYYFLREGALEKAESQATDLAKPITFADGGLTLMIALAMFMGCNEIYLFGCGYTYTPVQLFHFYDCLRYPTGLSKSEMEARMNTFQLEHPEAGFQFIDANSHTVNGGETIVDFSYDPANHPEQAATDFYRTHRIIRSLAETKGIRILNVVPSGYNSPVYERALWESGAIRISASG